MKKAQKSGAIPETNLSLRLPVHAAVCLIAAWLAYVFVHSIRIGYRFYAADWADTFKTLLLAPPFIVPEFLKVGLLGSGLWFGLAGVGSALRRALCGPRPRSLEIILVDAALGYGALSILLLVVGFAGAYSRPTMLGLFAGIVAAGAFFGMSAWRQDKPTVHAGMDDSLVVHGAVALIALAAASNLMAALAPQTFYDALLYHLALPKLYLLRGAVVPTPENVFSGLPLGAQMLYGLALALSGEDLAGLLHASFGLAAGLALWACMRRSAGHRTGVLAALLFYLCPLVLYSSWSCGVDLAAAFYTTALLCAVTGVFGEPRPGARGTSIAVGLLAAFAVGAKLNALPVAAAAVSVYARFERRSGRGWESGLWAAGAFIAALAPWLIKDWWFYGNPFYPFLHEYLGRLKPKDWPAFLGAAGSRDLRAAFATWRGFADFAAYPFRCTLTFWPIGDWGGLVLMPFAAVPLCLRWNLAGTDDREAVAWRMTAAVAAVGVCAWWVSSSLVRFILPALPAIAGAEALAIEKGAWPRGMKTALWCLALLGCLVGFEAAWREGKNFGQWGYLRGEVSRDAYLRLQRPPYGMPPYSAAMWVNANVPEGARVLLLGESRGFRLERDFIAASVFDENPFWAAASAATDDDDLRRRLAALGVTHILLNVYQLHYRRNSAGVLPRALAGSDLVDRFFRRWLDRIWEDRQDEGYQQRWLVVYALRAAPNEGTAPENPVRNVLAALRERGE